MSPSKEKARLRPSGETSTSIHVPSSVRIGTCRIFAPRGALTSHFSSSGSAAAGLAVAGAASTAMPLPSAGPSSADASTSCSSTGLGLGCGSWACAWLASAKRKRCWSSWSTPVRKMLASARARRQDAGDTPFGSLVPGGKRGFDEQLTGAGEIGFDRGQRRPLNSPEPSPSINDADVAGNRGRVRLSSSAGAMASQAKKSPSNGAPDSTSSRLHCAPTIRDQRRR